MYSEVEPKPAFYLSFFWVAVKELILSYHNGYVLEIMGFPQYSNLI